MLTPLSTTRPAGDFILYHLRWKSFTERYSMFRSFLFPVEQFTGITQVLDAALRFSLYSRLLLGMFLFMHMFKKYLNSSNDQFSA